MRIVQVGTTLATQASRVPAKAWMGHNQALVITGVKAGICSSRVRSARVLEIHNFVNEVLGTHVRTDLISPVPILAAYLMSAKEAAQHRQVTAHRVEVGDIPVKAL